MKKYIYPAIFTPEEGGYCVRFPDLESCYTEGDSLEDAFDMAQDVLALTLYRLEEAGAPIPAPSAVTDIPEEGGAFVSLVDADTTQYRKLYDNRVVKKTLTMPSWLNTAAEQAGVNFSQVLQEALKQRLGVQER